MPSQPLSETVRQHREFLEKEARTALGVDDDSDGFRESLKTLIQLYCGQEDLANAQVRAFLEELPRTSSPAIDTFIAWHTLEETEKALRDLTGEEISRQEIAEQAKEMDDILPKSDDADIRTSAGYTNDREVADSSLTDKAREQGITDDDISRSAEGDQVYSDKFIPQLPRSTLFMREVRTLIEGILHACYPRLQLLREAHLVTRDEIARQARSIILQVPRLPKPSDELQ